MAQHAHRVVGVVAVFPILIGRERGSQYADRRPAEFAHGAHTIADRRQFCRNNVRAIKRKARREGRADRKYASMESRQWPGLAHDTGPVCPIVDTRRGVAAATRRATHLDSCPALCAKIFSFPKIGKYDLTLAVSSEQEGRSANRHDTSGGMRWTLTAHRRCAPVADGQVVWSWSPDAGIKPVERFKRRRRLASPALRREHEVSRKPSCRECRIVSAHL